MIKSKRHKRKAEVEPTAVKGIFMRPMTEEDHPFLLKLFGTTRERELEMVAEWTAEQKMEFIHFQWKAQLTHYQEHYPNATHHILLKKETKDKQRETVPIGRLYVEREPDLIRLMDIALLPDYRNRGWGGQLIQALLDEAAQHDQLVRLYVFKENHKAHQLYQRMGFQDLGEEGGLYLKMEWRDSR